MFSRSTTASIKFRVFWLELSLFTVRLDAQTTGPCGFRPLLPEEMPDISERLSASLHRFHLAADTLTVRLTVPPVGSAEDLHLQVNAPCRAHKQKAQRVTLSKPLMFLMELIGIEPTTS